MTRGISGFVRDNLEAFAVAIALALVVRHYCLEAFRIPSKSMMPTLYGSDQSGDRILVDKFRWLRGDPHRWEPTVFQYPLNRSKNFIKRLVGMPGEWMRITDGDIWTSRDERKSWKIERKPPDAQEALFFPYYPEPVESRGFFAKGNDWEGDPGWEVAERARRFDVDTREKAALRFLDEVVPYQSEGMWGDVRVGSRSAAGDLRVRFDLRVERAGTLSVVLTEHGLAHRLVLGPEGSKAVIALSEGDERPYPIDARLKDGMELSVSFANVDDTLLVDLEGDVDLHRAIEFPASEAGPQPGKARNRVMFEAEALKATITGIRIDRDVHYDNDGEWWIPEGNYFMLGDNTSASKDSRKWYVAEVYLRDGTEIRWEEGHDQQPGDVPGQPDADFEIGGPAPSPDFVDSVIEVKADVDGLLRRFHTRDVVRKGTRVPYGVVSRDHLVGRAFAIFFPIYVWPVLKAPTRVGLIR